MTQKFGQCLPIWLVGWFFLIGVLATYEDKRGKVGMGWPLTFYALFGGILFLAWQ